MVEVVEAREIHVSDAFCCPVCAEAYNVSDQERRPMVIKCGHTICKRCVSTICPLCRVNIDQSGVNVNFALEHTIQDAEKAKGDFSSTQNFKNISFCCDCVKLFAHNEGSFYSVDHEDHKTIPLANKSVRVVKKLYWIQVQVKEGLGDLKRSEALLNVFTNLAERLAQNREKVRSAVRSDYEQTFTQIKQDCEKLLNSDQTHKQSEAFKSLLELRKLQVDIGETLFRVAQSNGSNELRSLITDDILKEIKKDAADEKHIGPSLATIEKFIRSRQSDIDLEQSPDSKHEPMQLVGLGKRRSPKN